MSTRGIANKGFSGMRIHHPHQSFVSVDRKVVPQSLTGHTANVGIHCENRGRAKK